MPLVRTPDEFRDWAARRLPGLTYVGPDPHYGIGLEPLLSGYRIACADRAPALDILRGRGIRVKCASELDDDAEGVSAERDVAVPGDPRAPDDVPGEPASRDEVARVASAGRSAQAVLQDPRIAAFVDEVTDGPLLVFKTSHALETLCSARGWRLLAAPAAVGRRWENKVAFRSLAEGLGLTQPPGAVADLEATSYADWSARLGPELVIQAAHGYSGAKTYLVQDAAAFRRTALGLRGRPARIAAYMQGRPLTLNACVTARGVASSLPFCQLTGTARLTPYRLGSCGNDWTAAAALSLDPEPYVRVAKVVGEALAGVGFRGVFGLDFVEGEDGRPYLIEVNPRLVASIALFTQLELDAGRLPLLARHLLALVEPEADGASLDLHQAPVDGGQVILHNVRSHARAVVGGLRTGAYAWTEEGGLAYRRPALRVDELVDADEVLVLAPEAGRRVAGGAEVLRIQDMGGVMTASGRLKRRVGGILGAIESTLWGEDGARTQRPGT